MPASSMASALSRSPAVSISVAEQPPRSRWTSMASRVVPAIWETIGDVAAGQRIHQGRFASVRRARDDDRDAVADALAGAGRRKLGLEGLKHGPHQRADAEAERLRHVALVRKIDLRLDQRGGLKQRGAPASARG